jgi:GYF domain 2
MNWYYVSDNAQKGPVERSELERLVQTGVVTPTTLVWQEGMTDWQPYGEVAAGRPAAAPAGSLRAGIVCSECGRTFGLDEVVRLPIGYVCAACKPFAMQKLSEGVTNSTAEQIRLEHIKHEASVKSVGFLYFLSAAILILIGSLGVASSGGRGMALVLFFLVIGVAQIWVGIGLRGLKSWARVPTGILSGLGLLGFPLGTLINGYILYLVFSKKGATVFSEDYKQIIEQTPHIKYKTSIVVWILLILLLVLIGAGLLAALFAGRR